MSKTPKTTYIIRRAQLLVNANLTECLRDHNITPMQYLLLSLSKRGGEMSSAKLARRFATSPQSMNEMIALLEQKGLIIRTVAGEKRRTLQISLTPEGSQLLKACDRQVDRMEKRLFSALSDSELDTLRSILTKFAASQLEMRAAG